MASNHHRSSPDGGFPDGSLPLRFAPPTAHRASRKPKGVSVTALDTDIARSRRLSAKPAPLDERRRRSRYARRRRPTTKALPSPAPVTPPARVSAQSTSQVIDFHGMDAMGHELRQSGSPVLVPLNMLHQHNAKKLHIRILRRPRDRPLEPEQTSRHTPQRDSPAVPENGQSTPTTPHRNGPSGTPLAHSAFVASHSSTPLQQSPSHVPEQKGSAPIPRESAPIPRAEQKSKPVKPAVPSDKPVKPTMPAYSRRSAHNNAYFNTGWTALLRQAGVTVSPRFRPLDDVGRVGSRTPRGDAERARRGSTAVFTGASAGRYQNLCMRRAFHGLLWFGVEELQASSRTQFRDFESSWRSNLMGVPHCMRPYVYREYVRMWRSQSRRQRRMTGWDASYRSDLCFKRTESHSGHTRHSKRCLAAPRCVDRRQSFAVGSYYVTLLQRVVDSCKLGVIASVGEDKHQQTNSLQAYGVWHPPAYFVEIEKDVSRTFGQAGFFRKKRWKAGAPPPCPAAGLSVYVDRSDYYAHCYCDMPEGGGTPVMAAYLSSCWKIWRMNELMPLRMQSGSPRSDQGSGDEGAVWGFDVHYAPLHLRTRRAYSEIHGIGNSILRRLLLAYYLHNPGVGYCQGMNMIAGCIINMVLSVFCQEPAADCAYAQALNWCLREHSVKQRPVPDQASKNARAWVRLLVGVECLCFEIFCGIMDRYESRYTSTLLAATHHSESLVAWLRMCRPSVFKAFEPAPPRQPPPQERLFVAVQGKHGRRPSQSYPFLSVGPRRGSLAGGSPQNNGVHRRSSTGTMSPRSPTSMGSPISPGFLQLDALSPIPSPPPHPGDASALISSPPPHPGEMPESALPSLARLTANLLCSWSLTFWAHNPLTVPSDQDMDSDAVTPWPFQRQEGAPEAVFACDFHNLYVLWDFWFLYGDGLIGAVISRVWGKFENAFLQATTAEDHMNLLMTHFGKYLSKPGMINSIMKEVRSSRVLGVQHPVLSAHLPKPRDRCDGWAELIRSCGGDGTDGTSQSALRLCVARTLDASIVLDAVLYADVVKEFTRKLLAPRFATSIARALRGDGALLEVAWSGRGSAMAARRDSVDEQLAMIAGPADASLFVNGVVYTLPSVDRKEVTSIVTQRGKITTANARFHSPLPSGVFSRMAGNFWEDMEEAPSNGCSLGQSVWSYGGQPDDKTYSGDVPVFTSYEEICVLYEGFLSPDAHRVHSNGAVMSTQEFLYAWHSAAYLYFYLHFVQCHCVAGLAGMPELSAGRTSSPRRARDQGSSDSPTANPQAPPEAKEPEIPPCLAPFARASGVLSVDQWEAVRAERPDREAPCTDKHRLLSPRRSEIGSFSFIRTCVPCPPRLVMPRSAVCPALGSGVFDRLFALFGGVEDDWNLPWEDICGGGDRCFMWTKVSRRANYIRGTHMQAEVGKKSVRKGVIATPFSSLNHHFEFGRANTEQKDRKVMFRLTPSKNGGNPALWPFHFRARSTRYAKFVKVQGSNMLLSSGLQLSEKKRRVRASRSPEPARRMTFLGFVSLFAAFSKSSLYDRLLLCFAFCDAQMCGVVCYQSFLRALGMVRRLFGIPPPDALSVKDALFLRGKTVDTRCQCDAHNGTLCSVVFTFDGFCKAAVRYPCFVRFFGLEERI